ncbi:MAG: hypothetical protein LBT66_06555 [Methanobrevibacter sp.]|nr:hypothetical protein [Candidatus Methanovirga meridionalis]
MFINIFAEYALKVSSNANTVKLDTVCRTYYKKLLFSRCSYIVEFSKTGKKGRPKNQTITIKELKYAQIIREREGQI